jgi:mannosyltransferase OCH1-like enzyme
MEWNEDNFDINIIPYTQQAYKVQKYAFVSDYARFWILNKYGGIYFDTDVEVIRHIDDIIENGSFLGIEAKTSLNNIEQTYEIAPGLGMAMTPNHPITGELLQIYKNISFINSDGSYNQKTIVKYTTELLKLYGYNEKDQIQKVAKITIYPSDFFCPMDSTTGIITKTKNTRTIHHYDCSWMNHNTISYQIHLLKNKINRFLGANIIKQIYNIIH